MEPAAQALALALALALATSGLFADRISSQRGFITSWSFFNKVVSAADVVLGLFR